MKKNSNQKGRALKIPCRKMWETARLTLLMVCCLFVHVQAMANAQKLVVSLKLDNALVADGFRQLKQQTNLDFFFSNEVVDVDRLVSLELKDVFLDEALKCLLGQGYTYEFLEKMVVIRKEVQQVDEKKMITVKGRVFMADSTGVPGATVLLKGTTVGVITNMAGEFTIVIPETKASPVLVFSFVGLKTREVRYTGKDMMVLMTEASQAMDEVVVTGYQRIRKSDMVGSTNTVKREELFFDGTNSIEQMLQGKLPGMVVMNTSGLVGKRQKVRVRGTSTLLGNQEPVWVVDGIIQEDPLPFKSTELDALGNISQDNFDMVKDFVGNAISWLNPNDIEDITVLKDASATVMYGVKAANGVILIKTKRGQAGRMSVNYSGNVSVTPRLTYKKMNLMNSKERIDVSREVYARGLTGDRDLEDVGYEKVLKSYLAKKISYDQFNDEVKRLERVNTDWFDLLFQNSVSMNHSVSLSGGTDKFSYYGSMNATTNKGTSIGNESTTYSGAVGITARFGKNVDVSLRLNGSTSDTKGYFQVDPYGYASKTSRVIPCFEENGDLFFYPEAGNKFNYNILHEMDMTGNKNTNRSMSLSASFRWDIIKGLTFESSFGLNTSNVTGESWADEKSNYITANYRGYEFGTQMPSSRLYKISQLPHGGQLNTTENRNLNYTWRNTLSYNYVLAEKHRFGLMLGQEVRSSKYDGFSSTVFGYLPSRGKTVLLPPTVIQDPNDENKTVRNSLFDHYQSVVTDRKSTFIGLYGSFTYGFGERYILTASLRSDASNRFGQDTKSRFLPVWSLGGRWNVSNEPWMQEQRVVSDLNFRVSYGWQGNVAENYGPDLIVRMGSGVETIDYYTGEYMMFVSSLPYGNLRWEKTRTINIGTDFGLFQNKVMFTVEYYYKHTEDMIVEKTVPYAYGVTSMPINGGNMTNRGIEASASFTPVRTKNFVWSMSVNTSKNFNKVKAEMNANENWRAAVSGSLNKEGYPVSSFWAFDFKGLNPNTGSAEFDIPSVAENPEGGVDATTYMKYMGTLEPDFSGGISMSFRYKSLSLSTNFTLQLGGKKFLYNMFDETVIKSTPSAYSNLPKEMVNRWRKPGDERFTDIPAIPSSMSTYYKLPNGASEYAPRMYNYSTARVANASFLRCNSLSLSYTLPERYVKKILLKNLSFSASVSNPFIIVSKDFNGMDPEVATGSQPISQTYSFGVNISL